VLYTDVDGQCDKLWPMIFTSLPHWPTSYVYSTRNGRSRNMVCAHQNLSSSRDLTTPLSGIVCHPWASTCYF